MGRIDYTTDVHILGKREFFTGEDKGVGSRVPIIESDEEYGRALDALVIACVDIVFAYEDKILLGKRQQEPQPDWWVIGGRMRHGQTFFETAQANAKRELGLVLDTRQLDPQPIGTYNTWWDLRQQKPAHHGCHTVNTTLLYRMRDETEILSITPNKEYAEAGWFDLDAVAGDVGRYYHPCLKQIASDTQQRLLLA